MTLGLCLDNETDLSHVPQYDLKPYLTPNILLPPESYFAQHLHLNALPLQWVRLIKNKNALQVKQDLQEDIGKKLYHSDGKPYTKMDYYRLEKYGSVLGRLKETTIANRAAGMDQTKE